MTTSRKSGFRSRAVGIARIAAACLPLAAGVAVCEAAADSPDVVPAERLVLTGSDGAAHAFDELLGSDGRAVCFAFLHPACPLAQDYASVLESLAADFAGQGIRLVGVVCECDEPAEIARYRAEYGIGFPVHLDPQFRLAEALAATTTPEAVLVDRERRIRYTARIDDRYKLRGVMTPGDAEPELRNAIEDLLAGRTIREPATTPAGCPLDRPDRPAEPVASTADVPKFLGIVPHVHQLARWIEVRAYVPGADEPLLLLRVPQWDYNWQSAYYLRKPYPFPAGTRFEAACSFDNSAGNPRNPFDPPRNVWHSETIHDEMLLPILSFTAETMLDGRSDSFFQFWASTRRASFLKRLVEHRYKYVVDPEADGAIRQVDAPSTKDFPR